MLVHYLTNGLVGNGYSFDTERAELAAGPCRRGFDGGDSSAPNPPAAIPPAATRRLSLCEHIDDEKHSDRADGERTRGSR
jgi:hypothetical protein